MTSSRIRRLGLAAAAGGLAAFLGGCTGLGGGDAPADILEFDQWTVFVYASCDNQMGFDFLARMQEMARAQFGRVTGDKRAVNLVVYVDYNGADGRGGGLLPDGTGFANFPTGTRVYYVPGNAQPIKLIAQDDERDFDSGATLQKYMIDCFTRYPSERRMVLMYGPGGGWITSEGGPNIFSNFSAPFNPENEWQGGFGGDTNNGAFVGPVDNVAMSAPEAAFAMQNAATALSRIDQSWAGFRPIDIVSFDAGLMGSMDCAWSFRNVARTFMAPSELDLSATGYDYISMFTFMAGNNRLSANDMVRTAVDFWDRRHYRATQFASQEQVPERDWRGCIGIDLGRTGNLASRLEDLRRELAASSAAVRIRATRQQFFATPGYGQADTNDIMYGSPVGAPTSESRQGEATNNPPGQDMDDACAYNILKFPYYRDLRHFLLNLEGDTTLTPGINAAATDARIALEDMVINRSIGKLREQFGQSGVNVELALGHPYLHNSGAPPFDHHPSPRYLFTYYLEGFFPLATHWYQDQAQGGGGWRNFMLTLLSGQSAGFPVIQDNSDDPSIPVAANLTSQGANESQKPTLYLHFPSPETCYVAVTLERRDVRQRWALVADSYVEPGRIYRLIWGGERYEINNGAQNAWIPVMVMPSGQIGPGVPGVLDRETPPVYRPWPQVARQYQIPGFLQLGDTKYQCALLFRDLGLQRIDTITVKAYGWNIPRPLAEFAGSTFQARIHSNVDGWSPGVGDRWFAGGSLGIASPPANGAFTFRPNAVEAGQYRLIVEAVNVDGHITRRFYDVNVPSRFGPISVAQNDSRRPWSSLTALP